MVPAMVWQLTHAVCFKDTASVGDRVRSVSRLFLRVDPLLELLGGIDINTKKHFGVLHAAILCALANVHAGLVRIDPNGINAIGNEIGFPGELGNPETMVGIGGK